MLDFKKRNKSWGAIYPKIFILILCVVVIFLSNASWNAYQKYKIAQKNRDNSTVELEKLYDREEKLKKDTELLNTESGIETLLRQRFNVVKEGEGVIVIVEEQEKEQVRQIRESQGAFLWNAFRGIFKRDTSSH